MHQLTSLISVTVLAFSWADKLKATPMTLKLFDENFHSNCFCKFTKELLQPEQSSDRFLNLTTGEVELFGKEEIARRHLSDKRPRQIAYDASFLKKEACVGPDLEWHEFITDEGEWQTLVQKELERVLQTPTEQHSWVATIWSHVTVDHVYTTALGEKLGLPHHLDKDEEGNLKTPYLHSAFSQYSSMTDDFGPVTNPGYFVLPLDARMAKLAQDEKLFEHLFPLPAMFKVHPSVRIYVDHAGRDPEVEPSGGEDLDIYLTPVAGDKDVYATKIADEWNAKLHQAHKDLGMKFFSLAPHMFTLERENRDMHSPTHMNEVVEMLAQDSRVASILLRPHHYTSNQYAAAITQLDQKDPAQIGTQNGQPVYGLAELVRPLYAKNIKGQGQVVGVGDSGLDYDACHFSDANNKITANQIPVGRTAAPRNFPNHRKILQYRGFVDNIAGVVRDHGTHVAGSVAGKCLGNIQGKPANAKSGYDGAAPEAKVAFFDMGRPGSRGLGVPPSLHVNFFPPARSVGAFIHTNSWGSSQNVYTSGARDADLYQYVNQDFLILVAAGNDGQRRGPASLGAPATAKNIIGVGASFAPKNTFADSTIGACTPPRCGQLDKMENSMASFSSSGPAFDYRQQPVVVAPGRDIISSNSAPAPGQTSCTVVQMQGTSMATPIVAGNAALVRQYFTEGFYPTGQAVAANSRKPMGALIKAAIVNGARVIDNRDNIGQPLKHIAQPKAAALKGKPDTVQGQGLVTLMHSLYFPDGPAGFGMRVLAGFCPGGSGANGGTASVDALSCTRQNFLQMENIATATSEKTYTVPVNANSPLGVNVTLAWSDPPATLGNRGAAIINNLDLTVQTNTGTTIEPLAPVDGKPGKINRDVVEKVVISKEQLQGVTTLTIKVTATTVPVGPQPFALVAGGAVASIQQTAIQSRSLYFDDEQFDRRGSKTADVAAPLGLSFAFFLASLLF